MKAFEILETHNLAKTRCRVEILSAFISQKTALSESELKLLLKNDFDRTTIYRTIRFFLDKNVIHQIPISKNDTRFALNKQFAGKSKSKAEHLHFTCSCCGRVFCLPDKVVVDFELPSGFLGEKSKFLIIGTCPDCPG